MRRFFRAADAVFIAAAALTLLAASGENMHSAYTAGLLISIQIIFTARRVFGKDAELSAA